MRFESTVCGPFPGLVNLRVQYFCEVNVEESLRAVEKYLGWLLEIKYEHVHFFSKFESYFSAVFGPFLGG